jgi:hypothetical protein
MLAHEGYDDGVPTEPQPLRVSDLARRAADIVDPEDDDPVMGDFERALEDDDRPVTAVQNLEEHLAMVAGGLETEDENPAVAMAAAVVLYLAHRRDEADGEPADVLRLATRAEWRGDPPRYVVDWLADRGVSV